MKYLSIILLASIILLSSCTNKKKEEDSSKYIPREKMVLVLADMQIAEAYLEKQKKNMRKLKDSTLLYYEKVFKKHQISPLEFEESLLWYKKDYDDLDLLYIDVITRLNELKAKNEELLLQMKADSIRVDSIAKAEFLLDSIQSHIDSIQIHTDSIQIQTDSVQIQTDSIPNHQDSIKALEIEINDSITIK